MFELAVTFVSTIAFSHLQHQWSSQNNFCCISSAGKAIEGTHTIFFAGASMF